MESNSSCQFVLASGSPRRREMLEWLGFPFTVKTLPIDEKSSLDHPGDKAVDIAEKKCVALKSWLHAEKLDYALILAADTIVSKDGQCFGKPVNEEEARKTLSFLSGKTHSVYTGVALGFWEKGTGFKKMKTFYEETKVEFYPIALDLMDQYIKSGEHKDKAGAYGIQGQALTFIKGIVGSYSNVVGLPLSEVVQEIKELLLKKPGDQSLKDLFSQNLDPK